MAVEYAVGKVNNDGVIEARHKEEERATLNPPHAIRNGYDILNPNNLQQSLPQHSETPIEAMILGYSLK
ncbi:hypothetical protein JHK84_045193 [Glycine max]|nr:hypothetical protein JHK86_045135 [Glycine max]KAG5108286.1 hypothetical protein JHK84_045193 [Glycine max]